MEQLDLRTPKQRKREQLHENIAARFKEIRGRVEPSTSDHSIFIFVADEFDVTATTARKICIAKGVAQLRSHAKE